ncbi:MAG: hypothetical protein IJ297_04750 [Clostridia bacterium]|nr:hypothetical protein [Clostridia bacterium]
MDKTLIIKELQNSQKQIGTKYYNHAHECVNPNLKIDFLSIAREESDIIGWLNYELDPGDLPPTQYAPEEQVSEAYLKYSANFN